MANKETNPLVRRDTYNKLTEEHNALMRITTGPGLLFNLSPGGLALWLDPSLFNGSLVTLGNVLSSEATYEYSEGLPVQWRYTVQPVIFSGSSANLEPDAGYSGEFINDTSNPDPVYAYNSIEYKNSRLTESDKVLGCGVNIERLKNTFPNQKPQPVPAGTIVMMIQFDGFLWFSYENAIDGECS